MRGVEMHLAFRVLVVTIVCCAALGGCSTATDITVYGDGDVSCPELGASDESMPVGTVTYESSDDGLVVEIELTDAEPNWVYYVEVLDREFCDTDVPLLRADNANDLLATDGSGSGSITLLVEDVDSGSLEVLVDIISALDPGPADERLREMAPTNFTEVDIP
jgi:hypothetical protein